MTISQLQAVVVSSWFIGALCFGQSTLSPTPLPPRDSGAARAPATGTSVPVEVGPEGMRPRPIYPFRVLGQSIVDGSVLVLAYEGWAFAYIKIDQLDPGNPIPHLVQDAVPLFKTRSNVQPSILPSSAEIAGSLRERTLCILFFEDGKPLVKYGLVATARGWVWARMGDLPDKDIDWRERRARELHGLAPEPTVILPPTSQPTDPKPGKSGT